MSRPAIGLMHERIIKLETENAALRKESDEWKARAEAAENVIVMARCFKTYDPNFYPDMGSASHDWFCEALTDYDKASGRREG